MRGPLTIAQQIDGMAATWPSFKLVYHQAEQAIWHGELCPLFQSFMVEVRYRAPLVVEALNVRSIQPQVSVLSPQLRPRRHDAEGQLPHVYYVGDGPLDVILCMFDPDSDEWSTSSSLAETTIPWAADWLASYEGWRTTGEWTGGGRHLDVTQLEGAPR